MKNIHVIPTDKPSRLYTYKGVLNLAAAEFVAPTIVQKNVLINLNTYITSDEEIKEGDYVIKISSLYKGGGIAQKYSFIDAQFEDIIFKKIILTTDPSLDGVQTIDDEFLEWFVKNPNCEKIEIKTRYLHSYKTGETFISFSKTPEFSSRNMQCIKIEPRYEIIIPQEEPKQMNKQTAVEWLIKQLTTVDYNCINKTFLQNDNSLEGHNMRKLFHQAKEMEKEQLMESFKHGELPPLFVNYNAEQYYNETYKKDK